MAESVESYFQSNRDRHLEELKAFLRFPSISTQPHHTEDVLACANFLVEKLTSIGFEHATLMPTGGHPVVYADWLNAPGKPTVLVYGHYDVQPEDPIELWQSAPFEPEVRDGRLYGRGSSDDKGPVYMHIAVFEAWFKLTGSLPVNVKLCIEGEEEIGSLHLPEFLEEHAAKFAADVVVISDTTMIGEDAPSICYGLRGLAGLQIDVKGAKGDLHSGLYGGAVQNPIHALTEILASMHDPETGVITVDGFYDAVRPLSQEERDAFAALPSDDAALMRDLQVPALFGEQGYTTLERIGARPTLEINGIYGGYQGAGTKTVLPNEAHAKVTCRLVPDQSPDDILAAVERHVQAHTPAGVTATVTWTDKGNAYLTPIDHPAITLAAQAYEETYGKPALFSRMGGSIPVVETFGRLLGSPVVLMGFGLNEENFHAPNEFFTLKNFDRGMRTLYTYWGRLEKALS